ncbi:hypothetical protein ECE50_010805 [Chitinophaga sp. Mgbs1]|uniref:Uncharacterized protein n=1 Tax=Chitinophaga solisilvae TaxID=1233460 RepID=A0A9Q5GQP4_9BACT|nr:hypothetical protein [Chitinophaga solisilvae]
MKKFLFVCLSLMPFALKAQKWDGPVGIGLKAAETPFSALDVSGGIAEGRPGRVFVAPYVIGWSNDVTGGQPDQYLLLMPLADAGTGHPVAGLSGTLYMSRGTATSYNFNGEYRVSMQRAYNNNISLTLVPQNDYSRFLKIYSVKYQGVPYAAVKISEILISSCLISFSGHWWNQLNGEKPRLVAATDVTETTVFKSTQPVFGQFISADASGNIGIGTTDTKGYKLAVGGVIIAERMRVKAMASWPDYVFENSYQRPSLAALDRYINEHKHLPEIPAATEVAAKGIDVAEMNALLLKKIEELTLYLIEEHKRNNELEAQVKKLLAK